jgi:hypothetical protein
MVTITFPNDIEIEQPRPGTVSDRGFQDSETICDVLQVAFSLQPSERCDLILAGCSSLFTIRHNLLDADGSSHYTAACCHPST